MPDLISVDETVGALREITIRITDDFGDPVTGLDEGDVTIKTAKPGANLSASSATLTEDSGSAVGGVYRLRFTAAECDTIGDLAFEVSSGTTTIFPVHGYVTIIQALDATDAGVAGGLVHSGTAQSGGANTITLAASASSTNDTYARNLIAIVGGTGAGQTRKVQNYIGGTKVATLERDWTTVPDDTSEYQILAADQQPGFDSISENGRTYGDQHRVTYRTLAAKSRKVGNDTVYRNDADSEDSHSGTVTGSGRVAANIIDPS